MKHFKNYITGLEELKPENSLGYKQWTYCLELCELMYYQVKKPASTYVKFFNIRMNPKIPLIHWTYFQNFLGPS